MHIGSTAPIPADILVRQRQGQAADGNQQATAANHQRMQQNQAASRTEKTTKVDAEVQRLQEPTSADSGARAKGNLVDLFA